MADPKSDEVMEMEEVITILDDEDMAEKKKEEANNLYKLKEYQLALPLYTEAIQLQPENASYYGNRSACYMMLGQYQKAMEDSKKSIEIDPKFVKGYVRIAKCYIAFGDLSAANSTLSKVQELDPGNAAALCELQNMKAIMKFKEDGDKAFRKKDYRKVVYCMDRAIALGVTSANYKILKAECLAYLGRYEEAQNIAIDVLHSDKQNPDAIYVRGLCLYYGDNGDNIDRVLTHFQHALKLAPDHSKLMEVYKKAKLLKQKKENGNLAFESSRFKVAYDLYTEALDVDPKNTLMMAKLYFNRATVLSKLGKLREAVADCTSALKLNEKYLKPLLRRAWCYMQLREYEDAVKDYTKVCEMERNRENERLLHEAKLALQKSKRKDYYKILGITKSATTNEIKKAYRNRALVHHPDRHASASEMERLEQEKRFKEVGEAYGVLSDPKKRARYDNGQDMEPMDDYMDINPNRGFDYQGAFFFNGESFMFTGADFGDCF